MKYHSILFLLSLLSFSCKETTKKDTEKKVVAIVKPTKNKDSIIPEIKVISKTLCLVSLIIKKILPLQKLHQNTLQKKFT